MAGDPQQPDPDAAREHERRDAAARAGDLARMAEAQADATWGDTDRTRSVVPGVISGDVGPKGRIAAQLRGISRTERAHHGEVPSGTVAGGGRLLVLLPLLGIAVLLFAFVGLVVWLAWR